MRSQRLWTLTLISLFACTPGGVEDDSSTGSPASETDAEAPTSGEAGREDATSAAATMTTSAEETGAATTADPGDECAAFCANIAECGLPEADGCAEECALLRSMHEYIGPECGGVFSQYATCTAQASCAALATDEDVCGAVLEDNYALCTTDTCEPYADRMIMCGFTPEEDRGRRAYECSMGVAESFADGEACGAAVEALYTCMSMAACEDLEAGDVCLAEEDEAEQGCSF